MKGGVSERQEIALRLADVVEQVLPWAASARQDEAELRSEVVKLGLPRRTVTPEEREEARAGQAADLATYERLLRDDPGNYAAITHAFHHAEWFARVEERCPRSRPNPSTPSCSTWPGSVTLPSRPTRSSCSSTTACGSRPAPRRADLLRPARRPRHLFAHRPGRGGQELWRRGAQQVVGPEGGQVLVEATVAGLQRLFD
ncbi:MAG: hypothetical protein M5U09_19300 [Gammaproteobacteria bacterium]|nr:hypothetical protein [Gammaproteobacteria bacterium]